MGSDDRQDVPSARAAGGAAEHPAGDGGPAEDQRRATPFTQQLGRVALAVIAVLFVAFAVVNAQPVTFSWIFGETEVVERAGEHVGGGVPLILLLGTSFLAGIAVGALATHQRRRARRRAQDG